jgi:predicted DNA binding protein
MGKYIEVPDTLAETLTGDEEELILEAVDNGFFNQIKKCLR